MPLSVRPPVPYRPPPPARLVPARPVAGSCHERGVGNADTAALPATVVTPMRIAVRYRIRSSRLVHRAAERAAPRAVEPRLDRHVIGVAEAPQEHSRVRIAA